jgi:hypothetical protein
MVKVNMTFDISSDEPANAFTYAYLESIVDGAKRAGYQFVRLSDMLRADRPEKSFVLRLDLDHKPKSLRHFVDVARRRRIPMIVYVRSVGPYNPLWYDCISILREAVDAGCDIGLHTAAVEWARLTGTTPEKAFAAELGLLRSCFVVDSIAPHRDTNYMYNTLPWIERCWPELSAQHGLSFQAYDKRLLENSIYVNEGLSPHLGWRATTPEAAIQSDKSIYMLLHSHWWFDKNPFEHD